MFHCLEASKRKSLYKIMNSSKQESLGVTLVFSRVDFLTFLIIAAVILAIVYLLEQRRIFHNDMKGYQKDIIMLNLYVPDNIALS